jgi:outer membrane protein assembly factor BamB
MPRFFPRRRRWQVALAFGVVVLAVLVAALVIVLSRPGNVSHPGVQFTAPKTTATKPLSKHRAKQVAQRFAWPWYGLNGGRTRDLADAPADLRPPLHHGWTYTGDNGALLEFPPSIYHHDMYALDDSGTVRELSTQTGKVLWSRKIGTLAAATPAVDARAGVVLMPTLSDTGHSPGDGRFVALSMKTGKVRWSRALPSGSESSPIVGGRWVYFGDSGGTLYALNARTGRVRWRFHASGAIKGGPALVHGVLYFGDYAGRAYAVHAATGRQRWAVSTSGAHLGLGSGSFYATPTVDYGRVYMGNTDGRMYSFAQNSGALGWATETGGYVYSSAAVADPRRLGPTVYAGSYDGYFYAFNARTGAVRWKVWSGGKISGSATIVGDVVYYADLATKHTIGLDIVTGKRLFEYPDGAFTAAVADESAVYIIGFAWIYEMLPGAKPRHRAAHHATHHTAHHSAHGHRRASAHGHRRAAQAARSDRRRTRPAATGRGAGHHRRTAS